MGALVITEEDDEKAVKRYRQIAGMEVAVVASEEPLTMIDRRRRTMIRRTRISFVERVVRCLERGVALDDVLKTIAFTGYFLGVASVFRRWQLVFAIGWRSIRRRADDVRPLGGPGRTPLFIAVERSAPRCRCRTSAVM